MTWSVGELDDLIAKDQRFSRMQASAAAARRPQTLLAKRTLPGHFLWFSISPPQQISSLQEMELSAGIVRLLSMSYSLKKVHAW